MTADPEGEVVDTIQQWHRRAIGIFAHFIASELVNAAPSCDGCLEDKLSRADHFCLNFGDGFEDDEHERVENIRRAIWELESYFARDRIVKRWKNVATAKDISPSTTPAYFETDHIDVLLQRILNIFAKDPHLCTELYESGNLSNSPEITERIRRAVSGTIFDRMKV